MHYICLASNQPLPNLTPAIDGRLPIRDISIVTPPERARHAEWLRRALHMHDAQRRIDIVAVADAYDLAETSATMQRLAQAHPEGCLVNITGGSKLLALAAWEALRRPSDRIFYVRPQDDTIAWLHPLSGEQPIHDVITLPLWLTAFGFEPHTDARPSRPDVAALESVIPQYHAWIQKITDCFQNYGITHVVYTEPGGYWLEKYLAYTLARLFSGDSEKQKLLHDVSGPFAVRLIDQPNIINELDGAVLYNNRLTVFEAKAGVNVQDSAPDIIYRLSRMRDQLGGWISQAVLVSLYPISTTIKERATRYNIKIIDGVALKTLRREIEKILLEPNSV